jgi:hypothetical protein
MPQDIHQPIEEAAAGGCSCSTPKPASFDFRGQRELDWDRIEMEFHSISMRAMAVEMVGRTAQDKVHGESLTDVFLMLAEDMSGGLERLKELLGLRREVQS